MRKHGRWTRALLRVWPYYGVWRGLNRAYARLSPPGARRCLRGLHFLRLPVR